jgi:hypothetical protein
MALIAAAVATVPFIMALVWQRNKSAALSAVN